MSAIQDWGSEPDERALAYPCDRFLPDPHVDLFRAVTVRASKEVVFRWLCQMRAAPYSYDWLDNFGFRSPQEWTPGLERLESGQTVMRIFDLVDFERDRQMTIRFKTRPAIFGLLGSSAATYLILERTTGECRMVVKLRLRYPRGPIGWLMRAFLPLADLIMMRRQLLNFKALAEAGPAALPC